MPLRNTTTRYLSSADTHSDAQSEVEWAQPGDGMGIEWRRAASLQTGRYGLSAIAHGNHVYALGGINNLVFQNTVEKLEIDAQGSASAWHNTTALPMPLADFSVVTYKDWIYVLGGTNSGGYYNAVIAARFNEAGDIGFWGESQHSPQHSIAPQSAPRPAAVVTLPNEAVVAEVIDTALYTYLRVVTAQGNEEWLAAARGNFTPDSRIRYSNGVRMTDFYSKALQRRFAVIRFVGNVSIEVVTENNQSSP
jgi:Kelch motif